MFGFTLPESKETQNPVHQDLPPCLGNTIFLSQVQEFGGVMAGDLFHLATVQENLRGSVRPSLFKCRRKVQSWLLKEIRGKTREEQWGFWVLFYWYFCTKVFWVVQYIWCSQIYKEQTSAIFLYSFKYPKFLQLKVLHSDEYSVQRDHLSKAGTTMICDC